MATCRPQRTSCAERPPSSTSTPERSELLIDLGEALSELGSFTEADAVLAEANAAAQRLADERLAAKTRVAQLAAQLYTAAEDWTAHADEAFEAALPETFEAAEDHDSLALAWRLRFGRHGMAMRFGEAAEAAENVIAHARAAKNRRYETRSTYGYAQSVLLGPTPVPQAIERCRQLLREVESDRHASAFIRTALAQLEAMDNRIDEARNLYDEAVTQLRELGSAVLAASSSIDSAQIEYLAGDLSAAERLLRADHEALTEMGERSLLPSVDGRLARVLYTLDQFDEAEGIARSAQAMSMDDDLDGQAMWRSSPGHGDRPQGSTRRGGPAGAGGGGTAPPERLGSCTWLTRLPTSARCCASPAATTRFARIATKRCASTCARATSSAPGACGSC